MATKKKAAAMHKMPNGHMMKDSEMKSMMGKPMPYKKSAKPRAKKKR